MSEFTPEERDAIAREADAIIAERKAKAAEAARAVAAAEEADVAPAADAAASTAGAVFTRKAPALRETVAVPFETRATLTGDLVINPTLDNVTVPAFQAPLSGLVATTTVSTGDVVIVRENVTYTDGSSTAEGDDKPEVEISYSSTPAALEVKAGVVHVSRQALADATQLQGAVNRALTSNLVRAIEGEIASVIAADAGIGTSEGSSLLAAIRQAIADVETAGYTATAVVLNPADAAAIDVAILTGTLNGPVVNGQLWGVRIVKSAAVAAGTAIVGDFASAVTLYTRGAAEVYTTDSHAGNFTKNIISVLAEARVKAAVVAPAALRKAIVD